MKRLLAYQIILALIATLSWSSIGWSRDLASDNFESYSIDSYPSSFWYNLFSGSNAKISSAYGIWGSKSFRLEGSPSWSRIDAHDLTYNNRITYQSWAYIPNSSRGAMVGFFEKQSNQAPAYNAIMFDNSGRIVIRDSGYSDTDLQAYSGNQWYLVIVAIDFNLNKMDVYINGTKKYSGSPRSSRSRCNIFGLATNNFSSSGTAVAYFDNVWFIDDAVITKEYHSSISTIGSFSQTPYIAGRNGKYAEVKLEFPGGFTNTSDVVLHYSHWYSQASGSVTGKIYISTSQQVTPPSASNDWETFWVGNATNLGTYVGSFTATNTMMDASLSINSYVQTHPSSYYYIAINNEAYADIGVYVLYIEGNGTSLSVYKCLYVESIPDPAITAILNELGFRVTTSATIPSDLSSYDLVICHEYSACNPSTAPYIGNFVKNGGGAILMGGTPSTFGGGGYSCNNIADWFGTSQYSNVGISDAKVVIDHPLGTSVVSNDVIEHCGGWGGAAVTNVAADVTILARWDYGSGNIHSFIRSHQNGRVAFWAGDVSYNNKNQELFRALCKYITTAVKTTMMGELPDSYHLFQNFPNPFNPTTTIEYNLEKAAFVTLNIYNTLGERINALVNEMKLPGKHSVIWDGTNEDGLKVASGIYFYQIKTNEFDDCKSMSLIK